MVNPPRNGGVSPSPPMCSLSSPPEKMYNHDSTGESSISDLSDSSTKIINNLEELQIHNGTPTSSNSTAPTNEEEILNRGAESDWGHTEYKYHLLNLTAHQKSKLRNQMKYRLNCDQEYGQAVYYIGLTDDGFALGLKELELEESMKNLEEITRQAGARICDVRRQSVTHYAESEEALVKKYVQVNTGNSQGNKDKTLSELGIVNLEQIKERKPCLSSTSAKISSSSSSSDNNQENESITSNQETYSLISKDKSAEIKRKDMFNNSKKGVKIIRNVAEVLIRKNTEEGYIELRVGIAGNVDSGKSTLLGVLSRGVLDNGRGSARLSVFNYTHEMETGRTSSVAQQIMGFNDKGESVNDVIKIRKPTWEDIVRFSTKILTFFDLCGHERYLRTTISGITSNRPDYAIILVGSNMGLTEMTQEHISLCVAQKIPFIIVMSKIDMAPEPVIKETYREVDYLIKKKFRKMPYKIKSDDDALLCAKKMISGDIVPIFMLSNVDGRGIPQLKLLLNYLPIRRSYTKARAKPAKMQVQESFKITGAGTVVGGLLVTGSISIGDNLLLGPMGGTQHFVDARVRSIHCKRVPVEQKHAGSYICVGIPNIPYDKVKTGIFLLSPQLNPTAVWEFTAKVYIATSNSTNIKKGYQPFCHIGHIKQTCKILEIVEIEIVEGRNSRRLREQQEGEKTTSSSSTHDEEGEEKLVSIGAGDLATLRMRFCFRPEVIFEEDKQKFVIREGRMRGEGMIINVSDAEHEPISNGKTRRKAGLLANKSRVPRSTNDNARGK